MMFKRILVANRGEIALRIIRTCRELDIETIAVYSTEDAEALHVSLATHAVCIGGPKPSESYLNMSAILTAAVETGCEAIHPGYGFLSENAEFAELTAKCGLKFIGPSAEVIRSMGNKAAARRLMAENGVPVVPGSGAVEDVERVTEIAEKIGYPVLVKASAGGGGRGMRRVDESRQLKQAVESAKAEAVACFGDGEVYLEKLILNPRHIEVQILADSYGNVVSLGERECSVQRKNQKLLEEAPSKAVDAELRVRLGEAAVKAAAASGYENAGTVEFVLAPGGRFYFIEMNTRIQVEHPVTEMVTGIDLIREQLRIASGSALSVSQEDVSVSGHAIECRINAENPGNDFRPEPGETRFMHLPGGPGVRVDTALMNGGRVSPYYDSLVAKLIVHASTRLEAIRRMRRALEELLVEGYPTNAELMHLIMYHPEFVRGKYDTGFLEKHLDQLISWEKRSSELEPVRIE